MSGIEDWCVFQKLSTPKPLCHPQLLNPSANLISACSEFGLFAFANGATVTFATFKGIAKWVQGGEVGEKYEYRLDQGKEVTHVVVSPSGRLTAVASQCDLYLLRTKALIENSSSPQILTVQFPAPVHSLDINPDEQVLVLTKAGALTLISNGQHTEVRLASVQSCCFSRSGNEIVAATAGKLVMLSAVDCVQLQVCETSLPSQVIGIRQVSPTAWAFMAIDPDQNTECYVVSNDLFEGRRFEDCKLYYEGDEGSLNPMRTPPGYDLKQMHNAYIVALEERELFLFASTVSTTIEAVYFSPSDQSYRRFDTETSKIKAQLGHLTIESRRCDILCRGLVVARTAWDSAPRFLTHYIDEDYDLPRQPLVMAVGMSGDLVSILMVDYREMFQEVETVSEERRLREVGDVQSGSSQPTIGSLSLGGRPEEEKKAKPVAKPEESKSSIFSAQKLEESKSVFAARKPEESKSVFALKPEESKSVFALKPEESKSVFALKPEEQKSVFAAVRPEEAKSPLGKPSEPKSVFSASKPDDPKPVLSSSNPKSLPDAKPKLAEPANTEDELYSYFLTQLHDMTNSITQLQEAVRDKSLSEEASGTLILKIKELRGGVEKDKAELERLTGPLQKLHTEEANNKLEFEALKQMRQDGLLKNMDSLLPIKVRKKLKMMEKRVILLQEYERCFRALTNVQTNRYDELVGTKGALKGTGGPRALKRFTGPTKTSEVVPVSIQTARAALLAATDAIRDKLIIFEGKLKTFQERTRPRKQEKRFDFSEVENIELDEDEIYEAEDSSYKPEDAQKDFLESFSRISRDKASESRVKTPQKLMSIDRAAGEGGKMTVKPMASVKIEFKPTPIPPSSLSSKIQQYEQTVRDISAQKKSGLENPLQATPLPSQNAPVASASFFADKAKPGSAATVPPASSNPAAVPLATTATPVAASTPASSTGFQPVKAGTEPAKPSTVPAKPSTVPAKPSTVPAKPAAGVSSFFVNPPTSGLSEAKSIFGTSVTDSKPMFSPQPTEAKSGVFGGSQGGSLMSTGNFGGGFGVQSSFSKPSIPTSLGGFAVGGQGGGFRGVMEQAGSSPFAALQSNPTPGFAQSSAMGASSELFKPRK